MPDAGPATSSSVRELFARTVGRPAEAAARAPGRVNLVGEHTDYHGGLCLPIALPQTTRVAVAPRADDRVVLRSTAAAEPWDGAVGEAGDGWARYVTATLAATGYRGGLDLLVDSDVPLGAGLSSSAALVCAVATATSRASPEQLVEPCIRAEVDGVGAATGGMDQTVALLARAGHALLLDFGSGARGDVPWRPEDAGLELLVVDTGTRHAHAEAEAEAGYRDRRRESEAAMAADPAALDEVGQRRRRHVVTENERVRRVVTAVEAGDWEAVGRAFTESHASLRDDYEVSCPELDTVVEEAVTAGALGARMTGGGFGGCALVLAPAGRRGDVLGAVRAGYAARGWSRPRAWAAPASGPATRLAPGDGAAT